MAKMEPMNLHSVTVTATDFGPPEVKFVCKGDIESPCHYYPDNAERWEDDVEEPGYPKSKHEDCWIKSWFDGEADTYVGEAFIEDVGPAGVPNEDRSGPITVHFIDGWIEWEFEK